MNDNGMNLAPTRLFGNRNRQASECFDKLLDVSVCRTKTSPERRGFYERLGAKEATNRFVNSFGEDSEANPWWSTLIFRYPREGDWPEGTIDLRGPAY